MCHTGQGQNSFTRGRTYITLWLDVTYYFNSGLLIQTMFLELFFPNFTQVSAKTIFLLPSYNLDAR